MVKTKITPHEISDVLFPINKRIRNVNKGGCGVVAASLYRELINQGIKASIVSLEVRCYGLLPSHYIKEYRYGYLPSLRSHRKKQIEPKNGAHAHYMVKVGNFLIDTRGTFLIERNENGLKVVEYGYTELFILGTISIEDLEYLNGVSWAWNTDFRRSSVPSVQRLIKQQLSKIFN